MIDGKGPINIEYKVIKVQLPMAQVTNVKNIAIRVL